MITTLLRRLWKLPRPVFAIERVQDLTVPMRDGVNLMTNIYHPRAAQKPPTVLMRTPYGRGSLFDPMARLFAGQGYTTVVQSVRGTFGSGGQFDPFFQERDDGVDMVDWIERQPWHQGKLGLWGASYLGFVEWAIAVELGDRIAAMATAMTTSDFHASIYEGGGFRLEDYGKWLSGIDAQERTSVLMKNMKERFLGDPHKALYTSLPLGTVDQQLTGTPYPFWRQWIEHDDPDDSFWTPIQNGRNLANVKAPVSMVGGWSDLFLQFSVRDFKAMKAPGKPVRLTLGPWTHSNFGGVGEGIRDALEWFDIHLKGNTPPADALDRVRLWVNGADEWRDLRDWPTGATTLNLTADGRLSADAADTGYRTFTYDPNRPTPSLEGAKLASRTGRGDMRELAARSDVLAFDGAKTDVPIEIMGDVNVTLTTSATSPHHDLFICLCDVDPGGKAINITDGYKRLSPASGGPGRRTTTIEALPVAWRLKTGHRLRLLVAAGAFPRYARNLGLGEPLATGTETCKVNITVYCEEHASFVSI